MTNETPRQLHDGRPLTVGQLRRMLTVYDDDLLVEVEGCDCTAVAIGISYHPIPDEPAPGVVTYRTISTLMIRRSTENIEDTLVLFPNVTPEAP